MLACGLLIVVCCCCVLFVVCCSLFAVRCSLFVVRCGVVFVVARSFLADYVVFWWSCCYCLVWGLVLFVVR